MAKSRIYNKNCIAPCFDNSLLHAPLFSQKQMKNIKRFFIGAFAVLILLAFITPVIAYAGIAGKTDESLYSPKIKEITINENYYTVYPENGYEKITYFDVKLQKEVDIYLRIYELQIERLSGKSIGEAKEFPKTLIEVQKTVETSTNNIIKDDNHPTGLFDFEDWYNTVPTSYGRNLANPMYFFYNSLNAVTFIDELLEIQTEDYDFNNDDINAGMRIINSNFWILIRSIYNTILEIGVLLLVIYLVLYVIQTASETGGFTPEKWLSIGLKFLLAVMVMTWGFEIITQILKLGNSLLKELNFAGGTGQNARIEQVKMALQNTLRDPSTGLASEAINEARGTIQGLMDGISNAWSWVWTFLGLFIIQIVGAITLVSRTVKIALHISLAPVALADSWNGMNSHSIKYFKQLASYMLQGVVIIAAILLFNVICMNGSGMAYASTNTDGVNGANMIVAVAASKPLKMILVAIGCSGIMLSSKKISDSILGA